MKKLLKIYLSKKADVLLYNINQECYSLINNCIVKDIILSLFIHSIYLYFVL